MKVVLQRVKEASVAVEGKEKAAIKTGFLLLVGISKEDAPETVSKMAQKISKLRVFEDEQGKMNLDVAEVGGEILSVPQFTLLADTQKGNRPGFDQAATPQNAETFWRSFNDALRSGGVSVAEGEFGAHMEVSLVNDGPVTLVMEI